MQANHGIVIIGIAVLCALASTVNGQLTLAQLQLTDAQCAALRASTTAAVPCECRLPPYDPNQVVPCHPNCCPRSQIFVGDRCHPENAKEWTPYEQRVCRAPTTTQDFDFDGVCFNMAGKPKSISAVNNIQGTATTVHFHLSIKPNHKCEDLFLASCASSSAKASDMKVGTVSSTECWITCPPSSASGCTSTDCWGHRGKTLPLVKKWDLGRTLTSGSLYALVCQAVVTISDGAVNQTQYHAGVFLAP